MPFKRLEGVALADVAFEVTGSDVRELLEDASRALIAALADPGSVSPSVEKVVLVHGSDVKDCLFNVLEEIIFLKDAENMVFSDVSVALVEEGGFDARVVLHGDKVSPESQDLRMDVKAVTLHYFTVERTDKGWRAQFVLDI